MGNEVKKVVPSNMKPWIPPKCCESNHWSGSSDSSDIPAVTVPKKRLIKSAATTPRRHNPSRRTADARLFSIDVDRNDYHFEMPRLKKLKLQR